MVPSIVTQTEKILDLIDAANGLERVAADVWRSFPDTPERKRLSDAIGRLVDATRAAERLTGSR